MVPRLQQSNCLWTGPPYHKCHCISQEWPDKQTCCRETTYKCSLLCINATLTLGQNHHFLRPLNPWREKLDMVPVLLWVPPTPWMLGCLTDTSGLPADRLHGRAESCSIQLADLTMLIPTCLEGCSPAMQEAMVRGLACGQEARTVLRPPLADSKDISRKLSRKLEGLQLWRHWVRTQASWPHQYGSQKEHVLQSPNSPFPLA